MSLKAVFEGDNTYNNVDSNIVTIIDISSNYIEMNVTNRSFTSYDNNPFTKTGTLLIDWGDNTIEVLNGQMNHNYSSSGHTIKVYGDITSLNTNCFRETTSIINIIIPNSVTSIGNYSFYNCTRLTSITLPNNIISLGNDCFKGCTALTSITLPNTIINLGSNCFLQCTDLTRITLPNSVTSIGNNCFAYCTGLTAIELEWDSTNDIISYKSNWIASCSNFSYFIIPEGTTSLYIAKGYPANLLKEKVDFDGISLTSDKNILSKSDNEYTTLTAQLTNAGSPVSVIGETVSFEVRKVSDDSLVETLSANTNASGVATVSYSGKGTGDIYIQAECGNVSDICTIRDVSYYFDETKLINTLTEYIINDRKIYKTPLPIGASDDVVLEFKYSSISNSQISTVLGIDLYDGSVYDHRMGIVGNYSNLNSYYSSASYNKNKNGNSTTFDTNSVYKIVLSNNTATWYQNDVQFASYSIERTSTSNLRYDLFNNNSSHLDYLIIML